MNNNKNLAQTVFVVDDDEAVCDSLQMLLRSVGLTAATYSSAESFLSEFATDRSGCLVLDVRMPGISGLDLAQTLRDRHATLPIIFITGHGDVPMAVEAMRLGAMDFLQKPFRDQELLDRIFEALTQDAENRQLLNEQQIIQQNLVTLTPREYEVLNMMLEGKANKVIALELDISQRTVEIHRSRIMEKMRADSLATLVKMILQVKSQT